MSSKSKFIRGVSTGWIALLVVAALQMWQVRLARANLTTEDFATFGVVSSLVATLLLVEIGARSAIVRLVIEAQHRGGVEFARFCSNAKFVLVSQATLIFVACLCCIPFVESGLSPSSAISARWILVIYGAITALSYASGFSQLILLASQRFSIVNALGTAGSLASFFVFIFAIRSGSGIWAYAWSGIPSLIVAMVVFPWAARRAGLSTGFSQRHISMSELKHVFSLGFDLFFVSLYGTALCNSFILLTKGLLTADEVAVLAVNLKLVQFALQIFQKIPGTAEPILARDFVSGDTEKLTRDWAFTTKFALAASILGAGGLYLAGGTVVARWTSSADVMSGWSLALLTLVPLRYSIQCCMILPATVAKSVHRLRAGIIVEIGVFAGLALLLGSRFGLTGILVANFSSLLTGAFFPSMKHFSEIAGRSAASLAMVFWRACFPGILLLALTVYLIPAPASHSIEFVILATLAWVFCAGAASWGGSLSRDERREVLARLKIT